MSFSGDLTAGLAQYLADSGVGVYRADGAYAEGETAIVVGIMPASPDRVVVLSPYPVDDDPSLSDSVIGMQLRCRGSRDPRDAQQIADAAFDLLHGNHDFDVGSVRIVYAVRNSGAPLGIDSNGRAEYADNYYLTVHRPSPHRE